MNETLERPSKEKIKAPAKALPPQPKGDNRSGVGKMFYLEDDLVASLEKFVADQEFPPTQTRVFSMALKEFLRARGYYPPKTA